MPKFLLFWLLAFGCLSAQDPATKTPPLPENNASTQDYSKQPVVIEQWINRYHWNADGTGTRQTVLRAKVQSTLGVQQLGQIPIGYSSANEYVKINYARVRKASGEVVNIPADTIPDLTAPVAREAPMYSDYRFKQIIVPSLEIGDTLEYDINVNVIKPLAENQFWLEHSFDRDNILLDEQLEIDVPSATRVTLKTNPGFEPTIETQKDRRIYRWKRKNLKGSDADDNKNPKHGRKNNKDDKDPDHRPDVQMTTFQSWQELGAWFSDLVKERVVPGDAVKAKAIELTRDKKSDKEKVEALYDFVSKQYRYVSLSFGIGRYQPHPAVEIFTNHYGDCKDKYTLLAAMLQSIGIHSDPVLINSWRHLDEAVPSPSQFDHVISAVTIDGVPMVLDATPDVSPFGLLAPTLRHKKALLVEARKTRIIETPATLPFAPSETVTIDGAINEFGKLEGTVKVVARGDVELGMRMAFQQVPPAKWDQLAQYLLSASGISGEASDVKTSPVADTSTPFTAEWKFTAANYIDWSNKNIELHPPATGSQLPAFEEENEPARQRPLPIVGAPADIRYRVVLRLPKRYEVTLPVPVNLTRDYGEYHSTYSKDDATNTVTIEKHFTFSQYEVPYSRRADYMAFQRGITADEQQQLRLLNNNTEVAALPDNMKAEDLEEAGNNALHHDNPREAARIYEKVVELEPKHTSAWNNLGLAYLQLGDKDKAEKAFRKQAEINPYDEYAYNNLGRVLAMNDNYDGAIQAYKKQIEVNPLDKFAHANLGGLLLQRKRYAEAAPELETSVSISPDSPQLHTQLGTAYLNLGKQEKAMAEYSKAIELSPTPFIWNDIAYELTEKGVQLDRARSYAEAAVSALSANLRNVDLDHLTVQDLVSTASIAAAWDTLGWVFFKQGDTEKALTYVQAAWRVAQHSDIADHLGEIYDKAGKPEDARHYYLLAAAARNSTPKAHEHAAKALGSESALEKALPGAKSELDGMRQQQVASASPAAGSADFFLLFDNAGQLAAARYVRGDKALKPVESALAKSQISVLIPQGTAAKIVRRASVLCSEGASGCKLTLVPLEEVNSLN